MKKLSAMLLALVMMAGCALAETTDFTGTNKPFLTGLTIEDFTGHWEFSHAEYLGEILDAAELHLTIDLTINGDSGHVVIKDQEGAWCFKEGTWSFDAICELVGEGNKQTTILCFNFVDKDTGMLAGGMTLVKTDVDELVWLDRDDAFHPVRHCFLPAAE